jgi:hypothetical protein
LEEVFFLEDSDNNIDLNDGIDTNNVTHSMIFNDENDIFLAAVDRFNNGYMDILRKFPDLSSSPSEDLDSSNIDNDETNYLKDSKSLENFTFDLLSATIQCIYIIFRDEFSLYLKYDKWTKMENGTNAHRLAEIDFFDFIDGLNLKLEESLKIVEVIDSLYRKYDKWIKMEHGANRLAEIDVFINELNLKLEEALKKARADNES